MSAEALQWMPCRTMPTSCDVLIESGPEVHGSFTVAVGAAEQPDIPGQLRPNGNTTFDIPPTLDILSTGQLQHHEDFPFSQANSLLAGSSRSPLCLPTSLDDAGAQPVNIHAPKRPTSEFLGHMSASLHEEDALSPLVNASDAAHIQAGQMVEPHEIFDPSWHATLPSHTGHDIGYQSNWRNTCDDSYMWSREGEEAGFFGRGFGVPGYMELPDVDDDTADSDIHGIQTADTANDNEDSAHALDDDDGPQAKRSRLDPSVEQGTATSTTDPGITTGTQQQTAKSRNTTHAGGRTSSRGLKSDDERRECLAKLSAALSAEPVAATPHKGQSKSASNSRKGGKSTTLRKIPEVAVPHVETARSSDTSGSAEVTTTLDSLWSLCIGPRPTASSTARKTTVAQQQLEPVRRSQRQMKAVEKLREVAETLEEETSVSPASTVHDMTPSPAVLAASSAESSCISIASSGLLPVVSAQAGKKRGRPRKHPDGFDGQGNRIEPTACKGIYRITYKTQVQVWRVTVYWQGRNHYLGTFATESDAAHAHDRGLFHYLLSDHSQLNKINEFLIEKLPLDESKPVIDQLHLFPPYFFAEDGVVAADALPPALSIEPARVGKADDVAESPLQSTRSLTSRFCKVVL